MYAIRLNGEPVWWCDGAEELYDTEEEAIQAINEEIVICEEAVADGFMEDVDFEDYRIIKLGE